MYIIDNNIVNALIKPQLFEVFFCPHFIQKVSSAEVFLLQAVIYCADLNHVDNLNEQYSSF